MFVWSGHSCPLPLTLLLIYFSNKNVTKGPTAWRGRPRPRAQKRLLNLAPYPYHGHCIPINCHLERSGCSAKRSSRAVERPLHHQHHPQSVKAFSPCPVWSGHSCPLPLTLTLTCFSRTRTAPQSPPSHSHGAPPSQTVILSEVAAPRSEAATQSKDPYATNTTRRVSRHSEVQTSVPD